MNPALADPPRSRVRPDSSPTPAASRPAWREDVVTLHGVPWDLYVELSDRPDRLRSERFTFDEGLLEIVTRGGDLPPGDWREQFVRLEGVAPDTYESLLSLAGNAHARFTYHDRTLEIEGPTGVPHERVSRLIAAFVGAFCELRGIDLFVSGAATWRPARGSGPASANRPRPGVQGDETYHIRSFEAVRGRSQPTPAAGDPPPDLAVEVVFGSPLGTKRAAYAVLGVGELWVWERDGFAPSLLNDAGDYAPADDSLNLSGFPFAFAAELLERRDLESQTALVREFREAVRPAAGPEEPASAG